MKQTYPLTQAQYDVFTECIQAPTLSEYNISWQIVFPKHTDKARLKHAVEAIVTARPILRNHFVMDKNGTPQQYADDEMRIDIPQLQMSEEQLQVYIENILSRPYPLLGGKPLCRFAIVETERNCYLLHGMHHIITDGLTVCTLYVKRDFPTAYAGKPLKQETQTIYEYALEEQNIIGTEAYIEAGKRYAEKFAGVKATKLSDDIGMRTGHLIQCDVKMGDKHLPEWCRQHHLQPNQIIQAAFTLVLARRSNEHKVSYLSIRHGRNKRELLTSYGLYANMMPVVFDVDPEQGVTDFIRYVADEWQTTLLMNNHSMYKFCQQTGCTPTIFFSYHGNMIMRNCIVNGESLPVKQLVHGLSDDDLQCMIFNLDDEHEIHLEGNDAIYDEPFIIGYAEAIKTCVHEMMRHADGKLKDVIF